MKLLLLSAFLISFYTFGQRNFYLVTQGAFLYDYEYGWDYSQAILKKDTYKEHHATKVSITYYSNNKKKNNRYEYYDSEGHLTRTERFYKGKKHTSEFTYDKLDNIIRIKTTDYDGEIDITTYTYNSEGKLLSREMVNKKGHYFGRKRTYNKEGKITSNLIFKKDRENPTRELHYSYYPDESKKQTIYKEKGKVKYTWNFECSEQGELVDTQKKETKVCVLKEQDSSGNEIVWTREFQKGKLIKIKTTISKGKRWISTESFDKDNVLRSKTKRNESDGSIHLVRNKKDEMIKKWETTLNSDGKISKTANFDKRWGYTYIYHYKGDLVISKIRIENKRISAEEFNYTIQEM